jgi:hypothetical protein
MSCPRHRFGQVAEGAPSPSQGGTHAHSHSHPDEPMGKGAQPPDTKAGKPGRAAAAKIKR